MTLPRALDIAGRSRFPSVAIGLADRVEDA